MTHKNLAVSVLPVAFSRCAVLPPLDGWPAALAAAAACFAGALGPREELGHDLRDVWKFRVGVQHVHGLLHFLQR